MIQQEADTANLGRLNETWLKAAVLGANWAASEIILGSFLHNLHIPFKGSILTAIGLVLLIASSYKWHDKGIFWRAALVCALMKTMSPSAVIFGPMIAIFMEGVLFNLAVYLLGRNIAGFLLGSTLAMSWVLAQKVFNYILYYGFNIVGVYGSVVEYAERQFELQADLFWLPVLFLLGAYLLFGWIATIAGIRIGKRIDAVDDIPEWKDANRGFTLQPQRRENFSYSLYWLAFSFLAIIGSMILINNSPIYVWTVFTAALVMIWVKRYKRGLRQLSKPRFWIFFAAITTLSALLISSLSNGSGGWLDGIVIGLEMNFRAAVIIVGFSVLGTELYNPKIRDYLSKSAFRQLPLALEAAFESLPAIVAQLPAATTFIRKPLLVVRLLIRNADEHIRALKGRISHPVFILSGELGEGKSSMLLQISELLRKEGISVGGIVLPRLMQENETIGYDLQLIPNGLRLPFLRVNEGNGDVVIGRYTINEETLRFGNHYLTSPEALKNDFLIIDEIGRLELSGGGWNSALRILIQKTTPALILSVRTPFVEDIIAGFNIEDPVLIAVGNITPEEVSKQIVQAIRDRRK